MQCHHYFRLRSATRQPWPTLSMGRKVKGLLKTKQVFRQTQLGETCENGMSSGEHGSNSRHFYFHELCVHKVIRIAVKNMHIAEKFRAFRLFQGRLIGQLHVITPLSRFRNSPSIVCFRRGKMSCFLKYALHAYYFRWHRGGSELRS